MAVVDDNPEPASQPKRPDAFISYSREDGLFVHQLVAALEAHGKTVWFDGNDNIPKSAAWRAKVEAGIESARVVVPVLSPDFASSEACADEIEHAVHNNKRFVPIEHRPTKPQSLRPELAAPNWIRCSDYDEPDDAFAELAETIDIDLEWLDEHARLVVRSVEWRHQRRDGSFLLRGSDLRAAERWLSAPTTARERPTELQAQYIEASRMEDELGRRRESELLANRVLADPPEDPELYILLALAAVEQFATSPLGIRALNEAMAASRLRGCLIGHEGVVNSCAESTDGSRILTASADGTARLWNAAIETELLTLRHPSEVTAAAFSPDASRIVTGSADGAARVWDAATGDELLTLLGHDRTVNTVAFSPNGLRIVTASEDRTARIWDAGSGASLMLLGTKKYEPRSAFFSPDGSTITTGAWGFWLLVWDATKGTISRKLWGGAGLANGSADGRRIVATSDSRAKVWDLDRRGRRAALTLDGHTADLVSAAFSPDDAMIVTAAEDGTVRLWDSGDGRELLVLPVGQGVSQARISSRGSRILTACRDGTVRVWDTSGGTELAAIGPIKHLSGAVLAPDRKRVVTTSLFGADAQIWDVTGVACARLVGHEAPVGRVAISPDGARIATASEDATARIWSFDGLESSALRNHDGTVTDVSFSPDGDRVVTGCADGSIRIWDAAEGIQLMVIPVRAGKVVTARFAPGGSSILALSRESQHGRDATTARVYDAVTGTCLFVLDGQRFVAASYSSSGSAIVTASWDAPARIWDARTGGLIAGLEHEGGSESATFSPDGGLVATTCKFDDTVRLWRAVDGSPLAGLRHRERVGSPRFSPDGRSLLVPSRGTIHLWNVAEVAEVRVLRGHDGCVRSARFSSDGLLILTRADDGTVRLWDNPPLDELVSNAKRRVFRTLTENERHEFGLSASNGMSSRAGASR